MALNELLSSLQSHDWMRLIALFDYSTLLVVVAIIGIELGAVGYQNSSLRILVSFDRSAKIDLFYWFINFFRLTNVVNLLTTLGILAYFDRIKSAISLDVFSGSPIVQFFMTLVVADFIGYWTHRFLHWSSWFWECHKVHHSSVDMNALVGYRFHPIDILFGKIQMSVVYLVTGGPPAGLVALHVVEQILTYLPHARIQWGFGWIGKNIIVSPRFHLTHHVNDPDVYNTNFGGKFVIWDKLFGTYHYSKSIPFEKIGVDQNSYIEEGILKGFFRPYRILFTKIRGALPMLSGTTPR